MKSSSIIRIAVIACVASATGACASVRPVLMPAAAPAAQVDARTAEEIEREALLEAMARTRALVPVRPDLAQPSSSEGTKLWRTAVTGRGLRVLVSTEARSLWLMRDTLVLFRAPVAVGMEEGFVYQGRRYDFRTPISQRRVLAKDTMPIWVPPDWHYFELAVERQLEAVQLQRGRRVRLSDGSALEIRGNDVGRVNEFGNFYAFTPGAEIVFDDRVYIPPIGTRQRQIPDVLGTHKLVLGDGYLIHGTDRERSIGDAVSHGCVRMYNDDVAALFSMVPVGTPVFIY